MYKTLRTVPGTFLNALTAVVDVVIWSSSASVCLVLNPVQGQVVTLIGAGCSQRRRWPVSAMKMK